MHAKKSSKPIASRRLIPAQKQHPKSVETKALKARLLSTIRKRINANKRYPRVAKKRGIQGSVRATFRAERDGTVTILKLSGSPLFYGATKEAIRSAFPITMPYRSLPPLQVSIELIYTLH